VLDVPQDYEGYILAQAKYLYLLDKGGDAGRIAGWKEFYEAGKRKAMASEVRWPDLQPTMVPEAGLSLAIPTLNIPDLEYQRDW
jgi:hypothetical protein